MKLNSLLVLNAYDFMAIQLNEMRFILLYFYVKGKSIKNYSSRCLEELVDSGVLGKFELKLFA